MQIKTFEATNFRNIESVAIKPHSRFNIFAGGNGQGKTNLLEAIYLLASNRSFRPQTNADLVQFDKKRAAIRATIERGGLKRELRVEISKRKKEMYLDGQRIRGDRAFLGAFNMVLFGPQNLRLFKGSPSERRRYLDDAICIAHPGFTTDKQHYEDVLSQRNSILKEETIDESLLAVYEDQLVEYGTRIIQKRLRFLKDFTPVVRKTFRQIFGKGYDPNLVYSLKWTDRRCEAGKDIGENVLEELFREQIEKKRDTEKERGYTLVGPHRDDFIAMLGEKELKVFGSQGQHRAFVLAMKIAQIRRLKQNCRFAPIFLLDDVSSELDRERNRYLFQFLREELDGQVFITTTHRDHILLEKELKLFRIQAGEIEVTDLEA